MSQTYIYQIHTHVTVPGLDGARPIVHCPNGRFWVFVSYCEDTPKGGTEVGDGVSTGHDLDGHRIVSVPAAGCRFWTVDEAESIEALRDIDAKLLSYAR